MQKSYFWTKNQLNDKHFKRRGLSYWRDFSDHIFHTPVLYAVKKRRVVVVILLFTHIFHTPVWSYVAAQVYEISIHCGKIKTTAFYPKNLANKCIFIWSGKLKGTKNASNHLQSTMFTNLLFVTYNGHEKSIISKVDFVMTFMGSHRPRPNSCLTRHIFYSFFLWCARVDIITNFDYKQSLLCCEVIYHRFCAVWKIWSNVWNIWSWRYVALLGK